MREITASNLITQAFNLSLARQNSVFEAWVQASHKLSFGSPWLALIIQDCGKIDILLRQMEEESATTEVSAEIFSLDPRKILSEAWTGKLYAALRLICKEPDLKKHFAALFKATTLVRVPLEKLQIADDRRLKGKEELRLYRSDDPSEEPIPYNLSQRPQISPQIFLDRATGSIAWDTFNVAVDPPEMRRISRIELSDGFLKTYRAATCAM
ncbi:hypothetical protein U5903_22335 [Cereibacter johrii]|uniref:hypothetical protein n=1 Tax=Cereibacter johrii TaxID=445629 RepID=UPI002B1FA60B|nr:hypothetical protein [Cereibacter johrii]MEA5163519.1 hypothetical protein [Cereibacter johrii]